MNTKDFENEKWREKDQVLGFRHIGAMSMIEKKQSVLDIGCGDGLFLKKLEEKGAVVCGLDISDVGLKKCQKKGLNVSFFDVATGPLPFPDKKFDVVVLLDVLEHLYFPKGVLLEAVRVSKDCVIVGVPNFNSLPARIQMFFGRMPENNLPNKGHVSWFNYHSLLDIERKHQLKIVEIKMNTFWEDKFLIGWAMKKIVYIFPSVFALSFVVKFRKNS